MISTLRRTWAEIDLDALENNYKKLKEKTGEKTKFLGVVKADAYGHGSVQVAKKLTELGADYLAVSSVDEAMELRENEVSLPILILGHTPKEQIHNLIDYKLTQTITCKAKALEYQQAALECGGILKCHIKVDTGMSRLGYLVDDEGFAGGVDGIVEACRLDHLEVEGIFTHFAMSDGDSEFAVDYTRHQFELFQKVCAGVEAVWGRKFQIRHCANTGAVANYPETALDMVRPGLLLYGYGKYAERLGLLPVMSLKSVVSTIKVYQPGTFISYDGTYVTDKVTRVGVLPIGYADGYHRYLSNKWSVLTEDGPAKQIGRICMDMCMIDLSDCPDVDVDSEVEIFGRQNSIDEMALLAETIPYELTCSISKRVPRRYLSNGAVVDEELLLRMPGSLG
ncbi:MAG: alanine racemase [Lachnospiraceae bacterium]|nr:alanine racemase [Lachnospiraceae bacterium]